MTGWNWTSASCRRALGALLAAGLLLSACGPAQAPAPTAKPADPPKAGAAPASASGGPAAKPAEAKPAGPPKAGAEAAKPAAAKPTKPPLKFALLTDVTKFSDWGIRERHAVEMAVEEINASGGINGSPIEIVFGDSASEPQQAATLTRKMANDDKVLAIWGPHTSGDAEVAFPQANELKAPMIASSSAKPGLGKTNRPWAFRNTATDDKILKPALEKFVERYKVKKIAIASDMKEAVAKSTGTAVFPMLAKALSLEIVNPENPISWQTGDQDFSAQVTRLKGMNVDGVTLGAIGAEAARLGKEMKRQGLTIKGIGGVPLFGQVLLAEGGDAVEGWFTAGTFWLDNPDSKVQDWVRKIRERHKTAFPNNPDPILDSATWYDTVMITAEIARKAGISSDTPLDEARTKIRDGWTNVRDYQGISGKTSIDAEGEGVKEVFVMEVKGGKFARVQ